MGEQKEVFGELFMSKKISLLIVACAVMAMTFYLAKDGVDQIDAVSEFLNVYLHTPQRYLYIVSFYILPVIYITRSPCLSPTCRVRIRDNIFLYVLKKCFIVSASASLYICLTNIFIPVLLGYQFTFEKNIMTVFLTLFTFVFYCALLYYLVYFLFEKEMLGPLCVFASNLLLLTVIYALNFYVLTEVENKDTISMLIFYGYLSAVIMASLIGIGVIPEKKECLK